MNSNDAEEQVGGRRGRKSKEGRWQTIGQRWLDILNRKRIWYNGCGINGEKRLKLGESRPTAATTAMFTKVKRVKWYSPRR